MLGAVVYDGPSRLDGERVVCIVTGFHVVKNPKTGDMLQTWILRADQHPMEARKSGADFSVCGDCKLREKYCYVQLHHGPSNVWKAWKRGAYTTGAAKGKTDDLSWLVHQRAVRFGAYGDPVAVPVAVWEGLAGGARSFTGYTHQWRTAREYRGLLMASVDNAAERGAAWCAGWRTFRMRKASESLHQSEIACPASKESGKITDCARCGLCAGGAIQGKSIAIIAHGSRIPHDWQT